MSWVRCFMFQDDDTMSNGIYIHMVPQEMDEAAEAIGKVI
jgi:hypothetical protein